MTNDLVSVIIPVYNNIHLLRNSLSSVINQTYPYIEIIVVDDGSKSHQKIMRISKDFKKKIKILKLKINQGVATALNMGIAEAKCKYINWLSHDDLFKPTKIEEQIKSLKGSTNKISATNFSIWDSERNIKKNSSLKEDHFFDFENKILIRDVYNFCTLLIPRKLFHNNLFDQNLRYTQDYHMLLKLSKKAKFIFLNKNLVIVRKHFGQSSYKKKKNWILEKNLFYINNMNLYMNLFNSEKSVIAIFKILFFLHFKRLDDFSFYLHHSIRKLNNKKIIVVNQLAKITAKICMILIYFKGK
jgi:glycosyltransferase involved in cell wall biosynthesis